jgi:radical SAM protein with 4Fe4S-binding SPASM domain
MPVDKVILVEKVGNDRCLRENLHTIHEAFPGTPVWLSANPEEPAPDPLPSDVRIAIRDDSGRYLREIVQQGGADGLLRIRAADLPLPAALLRKFSSFAAERPREIAYADFDDLGFFGSFMESIPSGLNAGLGNGFSLRKHKQRLYYQDSGEPKRSYWFDAEDRAGYFEKVLPERYRIPGGINIETSSRCILRCRMCWSNGEKYRATNCKRPKAVMDMDLYEIILRQIQDVYQGKPGIISPIYRGEPLVNRQLPAMIEKASRMNLKVLLVTNAMLLTRELSRKLLDAGLWEIAFSVNSHREDVYRKIHVGGDYHRVMKNISDFLSIRDEMGRRDVRVCYRVVHQEANEAETEEITRVLFTPEIFNISFQSEILRPNAPAGGGIAWKRFRTIPARVACWNLWWNCTITTEGNVLPCVTCTNELEGEVMGNVRQDHLMDIWQNSLYSKYRELHLAGRIDEVPFCRGCDQYEVSNWSNDPKVREGVEHITYPAVRVLRRAQ